MRHSRFLHVIYIICSFTVLLMSWELHKENPVIAASSTIPQEAIRLRILANSDSPEDQLLKLKVRDQVVDYMNSWVENYDSIEEAREQVQSRLPHFKQVVQRALKENGEKDEVFDIEFGIVDFPTKQYGDKVYPAGDYEALVVTIGKGKGKNWWCVLFPPLCFVEVASAQSPEETQLVKQGTDGELVTTDLQHKVATTADNMSDMSMSAEPEVKFFLAELFEGLVKWLKSLF